MIGKMTIGKEDKDMVALQHIFHVRYPGDKEEIIKSRMLDFGSPYGFTAVARTVALPAAIAVQFILEGKIDLKGVYRPLVPGIYKPVLEHLESVGIKVEETHGLKEDGDLF